MSGEFGPRKLITRTEEREVSFRRMPDIVSHLAGLVTDRLVTDYVGRETGVILSLNGEWGWR